MAHITEGGTNQETGGLPPHGHLASLHVKPLPPTFSTAAARQCSPSLSWPFSTFGLLMLAASARLSANSAWTLATYQGAGRGTCLLVLVLLAGGANGSPIDPVPDDGSSDLRWLAVAESLALLIGAEGLPLVARRGRALA